ncbi:hypothetical protein BDB01DRAFT_792829 [Pilobolus umbonatus]|nr:hypothetical protein BDB01DRAFT_792829 [Pilobolus umbonatus]
MDKPIQSKSMPNGGKLNGKPLNGIPTSNPIDVLEPDVSAPDSAIIDATDANKPLTVDDPSIAPFFFLTRVLSIPFIHDTTLKAHEYATKYSVTRFVLSQTENTVKKAVTIASSYAAPYAEKYRPQLLKVDLLGCQSLDVIESTFPVVREPTDIVLNNVKEAPKKVYEDVKEKFVHVGAIPITQVNGQLEILLNKWLPGKRGMLNNVKESPHKVYDDIKETILHLGSIPVNQANESLEYLLNTWLPEEKHEMNQKDINTKLQEENGKSNQMMEGEIHRLFSLANEMKDRLITRVVNKATIITSRLQTSN